MLSHRLEEMQEEVANFQELLILGVGMWSFQCVYDYVKTWGR